MSSAAQSQSNKQKIREFLIPSLPIITLYVFMSLFVLIFAHRDVVRSQFIDYESSAAIVQQQAELSESQQASKKIDMGALVTVAFWGFIGGITYLKFWFGVNFLKAARGEFRSSKYIDSSGKRVSNLRQLVNIDLFFVAAIIAFTSMLFLFLKVLYPAAVRLSASMFEHQESIKIYVSLVGSILLLSLGLHILSRLFIAMSYASHVFFGFK